MNGKRNVMWKLVLLLASVSLVAAVAGCATPTPIEKFVTEVVKEIVKETVIVEGTPEVVEREVTKIVEQEVTKVVEVEKVVTATPLPVRYCADGLEGEIIYYHSQAGLTGPLSTILGTAFVNALNDAIADLNAEGGICGAMVELHLTDTQYDPEQEIAAYLETKANYSPLISIATYGSGATIALKDMVYEDRVTNFCAGLNAEAFYYPQDGYTIGDFPIYTDQFGGFLLFLKENWDDIKPEGAGDEIVVGVIGWEGPFGAGATTPETYAYAESIGVTVLELETQAVSAEADVVTPLQSLALQGANVIYIQSLGFGPAQVIGTLRALGMWDSVVVGGVNWAFNTDVLTFLGESAPAAVGMYGVVPHRWWNDTDVEGVQKATAAFERGGYPETDRGVSYLTSYVGMWGFKTMVEHAINMVGYENLDGEAYMNAILDLGLIDNLGVWSYDVRDGSRAPHVAQIRQWQLVDGKIEFVVVKDFFELPDLRPILE